MNDAHIGAPDIVNQGIKEWLSAGIKDEIPSSVVEVGMLQEKLQHGRVSDCPNQVDATAILVSSNYRERWSDSDSSCHQDLVVILD